MRYSGWTLIGREVESPFLIESAEDCRQACVSQTEYECKSFWFSAAGAASVCSLCDLALIDVPMEDWVPNLDFELYGFTTIAGEQKCIIN